MPETHHPSLLLLARALSGRPVEVPYSSRRARTRLLEMAADHGVAAMLEHRIREGSVHGLTHEDRTALGAVYRNAAAYDLMLNAATRKTLDLLAAAGVPVLLLKGTPIAFLYYQDTYLRIRCDTDLFIRTVDRDRAAGALASSGYRIAGLDQGAHSSKQFVAMPSARQGSAMAFDIHWGLSNRVLFSRTLEFDECWETRRPLPALGADAYTLSPPHLLLHACIHRVAHGRNAMRDRLIWLYDMHLILDRFSAEDCDRFQRSAVAKQVGMLCLDALAMCRYYFHTPYPEGYPATLGRNSRREPSARLLYASKPRWVLADFLALRTLHGRLAFAGELLFPPHLAGITGSLPRMRAWMARLLSKIRAP